MISLENHTLDKDNFSQAEIPASRKKFFFRKEKILSRQVFFFRLPDTRRKKSNGKNKYAGTSERIRK